MNDWEKGGREFLKGCSNAGAERPADCRHCLDAFINHIQSLKAKNPKPTRKVKK